MPIPSSIDQGQHYPFIRQTIPACLVQSSAKRRQALKQTEPQVPAWYANASQAHKDSLKGLLEARCQSLNNLEKTLEKIQPLTAFAQPLLEQALKDAGYALDVNLTWLRLYVPAEDAFGVDTGGFKVKTFSLLQAALHNFEAREAVAGYFDSASGFITEPDAREHFERQATTLTIETFATLCRTLDLGAQYQTHLRSVLHPADDLSETVLRERCTRYQKDAFAAAACLALVKGDINDSDYALLQRVLAGEPAIMVGNKQIWYRTPCVMDLSLHGCLIIDPCVKYRYGDWFIAYFPDDPEHPIKRYETFEAFSNELTLRLKTKVDRVAERTEATPVTDYQQYFSQFVAYKDRPYYFRRLTEWVLDAPPQTFGSQWKRSEWGRLAVKLVSPVLSPLTKVRQEPQPEVRVPATDPNFNINATSIGGLWSEVELWPQRFESLRKHLLDDARAQAIPTADIDKVSSNRRLQHYLNIGLFGVNLVAMAIPPLGVVMSVVMAGQMLYEVLEGVIDLSQGDREAGWAHLTDVVENLAQLAAGVAVAHFTVSPFIEGLKSVAVPSGKTRLWKPDLSPYQHREPLPAGSRPNAQGIHEVDGQEVIELEDMRFAVRHEPAQDRYVIEHPARNDAYAPTLATNGEGAWQHELEQPLTWEGATLMRRLGPVMEGFSDTELKQILHVSGIDEDVLRRVHVERESPPAILLDTVRQFRAYANAVLVAQGIGEGVLPDGLCSYVATLAVELPGWPAGKAIEAFAGPGLSGASVKYGNVQSALADTLQVSRTELMTGQLPARIARFLSEAQMDALVGRYTSRLPAERIAGVQKKLQERAVLCRTRLMRSLYTEQQPMADAAIALIQRDFKRLPTLMVREMLEQATPRERAALDGAERIPLSLAEQARVLQQDVRLSLAYEGLYLDGMADQDTEALVLNTLGRLPGWTDNLRLEVHEGEHGGALRASFGPDDSTERKVLVRVGDARYEARNDRDEHLHGADDLYASLQHALPDRHRQALGMPHVGQGAQLKQAIIAHALPREQLRTVLKMQSPVQPLFKLPSRWVDGRIGYPLSGQGLYTQEVMIRRRVRALYPAMTDEFMTTYLQPRSLEDDSWLLALEQEFTQLDVVLSQWMWRNNPGRRVLSVRRNISHAVRAAWRNSSPKWDTDVRGAYRGQAIEITDPRAGRELATLPWLPGNFDHVTGVSMIDIGLTNEGTTFLASFRRLRFLDLADNDLTQLPDVLERTPHLEHLSLENNEIVLTPVAVAVLRAKTRLNYLFLNGNPLGLAPDIGRMGQLRMLWLAGCELSQWPEGIFAQPRPRPFELDLTYNELTQIPDVAPGSDRAQVLARTIISREQASPQVLATLLLYIESVGLDPERIFPARGKHDSVFWKAGMTEEQWLAKQSVWDALEAEPMSEPFFNELRKLSTSSDVNKPEYNLLLTAKVWRMLEAMEQNTPLRKRLFRMALAPTTCVDAGAQLFNAMGVEVLLHEALAIAEEPLRTRTLLELAIGRSRLDRLSKMADGRVDALIEQGRVLPRYDGDGYLVPQFDDFGNPRKTLDEVEIHLAYATRLADPLALPWQSRSMQFLEPDVGEEQLEMAYKSIADLERGDLLNEQINAQVFWADYLRVAFGEAFQEVESKIEAITDLQMAQRQWSENGRLNAQEKQALRDTITTAGRILGKSAEQVREGVVMDNAQYDEEMEALAVEFRNVPTTLTRQQLARLPQQALAPWSPGLLGQNRK